MFSFEHLEHPNQSPEQLLQIITSKIIDNPSNSPLSSGLVKLRLWIQDNGYESSISPFKANLINKDGVEINQNFLFTESVPRGYSIKDYGEKIEYIDKQTYCCILDQDSIISVQLPTSAKKLVHQKLGSIDPSRVYILKVTGVLEHPRALLEDDYNECSIQDVVPTIHGIIANPIQLQIPVNLKLDYRGNLIDLIKPLVMGDELATEYLIAMLFSKRRSFTSEGLSLCLHHPNIKVSNLFSFMKKILPTNRIKCDVESLNFELWMNPCQDRVEGLGLCHGELQQPDDTVILIDSTQMQPGKLVDRGLSNLKALQNCILFGSVGYEVPYASFEKEANFNFLQIGVEKSVLDINLTLKLTPIDDPIDCVTKTKAEMLGGMKDLSLKSEDAKVMLLDGMREFVMYMKEQPNELSKEMESVIQNDFAQSQAQKRQHGRTVDDGTGLLNCLMIAESISKSFGLASVDQRSWERARQMESQRLERIK